MSRLVYSSEAGRHCPKCERPIATCVCRQPATHPAPGGAIRVALDTQGRKGKGVTIVEGVPLGGDELKAFAKALKSKCGSGGTVKQGTIEIQGDHRAKVRDELERRGWSVKG
ncbi:MAG: stress response translation initiation inhibitor YciH [Planctomycetes bacterium]|nr:stress response translation initiation inhibitor YciH [Planctomycetota bacterium]